MVIYRFKPALFCMGQLEWHKTLNIISIIDFSRFLITTSDVANIRLS